MDGRISLLPGTELKFYGRKGSSITCTITEEIGRGRSGIVYGGSYLANTGDRKIIRIKECYPYNLRIERKEQGMLSAVPEDEAAFQEEKLQFERNFSVAGSLFYEDGLYDSFVNTVDIFDYNNSKYIVSMYSSGTTLAMQKPDSIRECAELVLQAARIIGRIHKAGYLYLDIKPDNILYLYDGVQKRIQLFDFDSLFPYDRDRRQLDLSRQGFRLSYTRGFAAVELQSEKLNRIGPAADVFGLGALFYYLLYGKTPTALQGDEDAGYSLEDSVFTADNCDDRLLQVITEFLHHTLASYYRDRYQTMEETEEQLRLIIAHADQEKKRVFPSRIYRSYGFFGREAELKEIDRNVRDRDCRCLFISGMGGIGKSTLIREYLCNQKEHFQILYLLCQSSVQAAVTDDRALHINKVRKADVEKEDAYFHRKLQELKGLVTDRTILVLDNFDGVPDRDFFALLELEWRVVVLSRHRYTLKGAARMEIGRIRDDETLIALFRYYLGRPVSDTELPAVQKLIACTGGHTQILELLAKQIAGSHILLHTAVELAETYGFSELAAETVEYEKDSVLYSGTVGNMIDALFETSHLTEEKRTILKTVSVLGIKGLPVHQLRDSLGWISFQNLNELVQDGWIRVEQECVTMHPVIQEAAARWEWKPVFLEAVRLLLTDFYHKIRTEAARNDLPRQLQTGSITAEAYTPFQYDQPVDWKLLSGYLNQAKSILTQCKRTKVLRREEAFLDLLCVTILNMPLYEEEYILSEGEALIRLQGEDFLTGKTVDPLMPCGHRNPVTLMGILKLLVCLHAEHGHYGRAEHLLEKARQMAGKAKSACVTAHYYDLVSEYLDIRLAGAYDAVTDEEKQLLKEMSRYIRKCMQAAKRYVKTDGSHLYIRNPLGLTTILIRSGKGRPKTIERMLKEARQLIMDDTLPFAEVRFQYHMVCAWYFALICQSLPAAQIGIDAAVELYEKICPNDLARIECLYVPAANIYLELQEFDLSMQMLLTAREICAQYSDTAVYQARDQALEGYMQDVIQAAELYGAED